MSPAPPAALAMSEDYLDDKVWAIIKDLGLRRYHTYNSRKSDRGFPDLVIAGIGGVLFRELKQEREKPSRAQQAWLDILAAAGADAGVWRPTSLLSGQVAAELTAISRPRRHWRHPVSASRKTLPELAREKALAIHHRPGHDERCQDPRCEPTYEEQAQAAREVMPREGRRGHGC